VSTKRWRPIIGSLRNVTIWLILLATWEAAFRVIGWRDYLFPAPSHVLDSLAHLLGIADGGFSITAIVHSQLVSSLLVSLTRLGIGFALSLGLGLLVGALLWRSKLVNDAIGPFLLGVQTLPSVCWVPLAVLTFGINEQAMMFVLVMGSVFAIALSLRDGLRTVPPIYHRAGMMLGARGWRYYSHILLPASLPAFASSLRQGFSFAWRSLMGGELILATRSHGLGYLLEMGRSFADVAQVVAMMAMMIVIGMTVDRFILAKWERRVHTRFGLAATT
jgi:NitT/TauT family transport system permease protein